MHAARYNLQNLLVLLADRSVDRLVGWLPGSASQILNGMANDIPGDRAWAGQKKDPNFWRATLAHELGHTYGLEHNTLTTSGHHWFDVYERAINPAPADGTLNDFIAVPGLPEEERWVSPDSYTFLYNKFCSGSGSTLQSVRPRIVAEVLVVSGNVSLTDIPSGELKPLYRVTGTELMPPAGIKYHVVLKNGATELAKYGFNAHLEVDTTQGTDTPTVA